MGKRWMWILAACKLYKGLTELGGSRMCPPQTSQFSASGLNKFMILSRYGGVTTPLSVMMAEI
jgi:hypothetical protein